MSSDRDSAPPGNTVQAMTLLLVALTAGTYVFKDKPFVQDRPAEAPQESLSPSSSYDLEDPLAVVWREYDEALEQEKQYLIEQGRAEGHSDLTKDALCNLYKERGSENYKLSKAVYVPISGSSKEVIDIIAVTLPDGTKQGDVSARIDTRYAINHALFQSGYVAKDNTWFLGERSEHITLNSACAPTSNNNSDNGNDNRASNSKIDSSKIAKVFVSIYKKPKTQIQAQTNTQSDSSKESAESAKDYTSIILWINEKEIEEGPLNLISEYMYLAQPRSCGNPASTCSYSIIGPSGSNSLQKWIDKPRLSPEKKYIESTKAEPENNTASCKIAETDLRNLEKAISLHDGAGVNLNAINMTAASDCRAEAKSREEEYAYSITQSISNAEIKNTEGQLEVLDIDKLYEATLAWLLSKDLYNYELDANMRSWITILEEIDTLPEGERWSIDPNMHECFSKNHNGNYETIEACLSETLNPKTANNTITSNDSNEIVKKLANKYQKTKQDDEAVKKQAISDLLETATLYLDEGNKHKDSIENALNNCPADAYVKMDTQKIIECLSTKSEQGTDVSKIMDSDENWRKTITNFWVNSSSHERAYVDVSACKHPTTRTVLRASDNYLDRGFGNTLTYDKITTCPNLLESDNQKVDSKILETKIQEYLESFRIPDSDSTWEKYIASQISEPYKEKINTVILRATEKSIATIYNSLTVSSPKSTLPYFFFETRRGSIESDYDIAQALWPANTNNLDKFTSTISRDDDTTKMLAKHLKEYNIEKNQIKLFVEAGSLYANALRTSFTEIYCKPESKECESEEAKNSIKSYSFNRRLDGNISISTGSSDDNHEQTLDKEAPTGQHQLDYLRRIVKRIARENNQLNAIDNDSEDEAIKAVGIFGGDRYDKLLLAQAIQIELGNTLIFTTDMDASLIYNSKRGSLRGMRVASSNNIYDTEQTLLLKKCTDYAVPSLRSSYQAAYIESMLRLSSGLNRRCKVSARAFTSSSAKVIEIGRNFPNEIGQYKDTKILNELDYMVLLSVPGLLILCIALRRALLVEHSSIPGKDLNHAALTIGLFIFLLCITHFFCKLSTGFENPDLSEGTNSLPALYIRNQIILVIFIGLFLIWQRVQTHYEGIFRAKYVEPTPPSADAGLAAEAQKQDLYIRGLTKDCLKRLRANTKHPETVRDFIWRCLFFSMLCSLFCWLAEEIYQLELVADVFVHPEFLSVLRPSTFAAAIGIIIATVYSAMVIYYETRTIIYAHSSWLHHIFYPEEEGAGCTSSSTSNGAISIDQLSERIKSVYGLFRLIARGTEVALLSAILPIIGMILFAISYNRWFEAWPWPTDVIILMGVLSAGLTLFALYMQHHANRLIRSARMKLAISLNRLNKDDYEAGILLIQNFEHWLTLEKRGAFVPFWHHPIVRIVALQVITGLALATQPSLTL